MACPPKRFLPEETLILRADYRGNVNLKVFFHSTGSRCDSDAWTPQQEVKKFVNMEIERAKSDNKSPLYNASIKEEWTMDGSVFYIRLPKREARISPKLKQALGWL